MLFFFPDACQLIAGSDNGSLKLYDIHHARIKSTSMHGSSGCVTFDEFDQLTSVHVNSTDELFLASGYSRNVALYDISSGKRVQIFTDMHQGHINVVKFANYSPSIFATSSFDQDVKMWDLRQKPLNPCFTASSSRGNVMVCFSPDDQYILASAVDNEVTLSLYFIECSVIGYYMQSVIIQTGHAPHAKPDSALKQLIVSENLFSHVE